MCSTNFTCHPQDTTLSKVPYIKADASIVSGYGIIAEVALICSGLTPSCVCVSGENIFLHAIFVFCILLHALVILLGKKHFFLVFR